MRTISANDEFGRLQNQSQLRFPSAVAIDHWIKKLNNSLKRHNNENVMLLGVEEFLLSTPHIF